MNFIEEVQKNISFDIACRQLMIHQKEVDVYYATSLASDRMIATLIKGLAFSPKGDLQNYLLNGDVKEVQTDQELKEALLVGNAIVIQKDRHWVLDTKQYPTRSVDEPETEKSVRGSKDGFTESLMVNVGLIRRRIKEMDLTFERMSVGKQNPMDVSLVYLEEEVDQKLLKQIQQRLKDIQVRDLVMSDRALEECLLQQGYNPFPLVRYSERPDIVATHIMNGHIAIICDTSSSVMMVPTTIFEILEHVEEYRQTPIIGTMIRLIRLGAVLLSLYLVPLWLLAYRHPVFSDYFIIDFETPFQTLVEIAIELLRIATVHTPSALSNAMGIVAAILLGDLAIELGMFTPEILLYCSIGNVGGFATPNYELSLTNKYVKILMIVIVGLFKEVGFILFNIVFILYLAHLKPFGISYLYPLYPFDGKALWQFIIRKPKGQQNRHGSY